MKRMSYRTSYRTGLFAEALCRWVLRLKGYRILASRYQSPLGEIDIVALSGNTLVVAEVKARPSEREAMESILPRQRQRLQRAALDFLSRHAHFSNHDLRFDIMLVAPRRWPIHIKDAWRP
jgi:putative endonuclease